MTVLDVDSIHGAAGLGELLKRHRLALGLTQEALAESAGLSAHAIQRLERGGTQPYRDTTERLIRALQLTGQDEVRFRAAARPAPRRRSATAPVTPGSQGVHHNLPHQTTNFIGRQDDLARVQDRLRDSRLLTITGAGGCGKTRLALEFGLRIAEEFGDGVWLIDLAPLSDASLIWQPLAMVLEVREEPGRPIADAVTDYLGDRTTLIIFDNCEHLIDACARTVDALLHKARNVRVLATSRELLGLAGEAAWRVQSLSVVDPENIDAIHTDPAKALLESEAARLFVDRARLLNPAFELTNDNAFAVAQICYRLDGIPLAIELAAARLAALSVDDLGARLDQRFRLLTGGYRTAVHRQQTLQATIDWSYDLLTESERALLRSLSVFAGGWSLEAAEAVSATAVGSEENVFELLNQLVRKSMIVYEVRGLRPATSRYQILETIRQYAEEKLLSSGESEAARTRHSDWYIGLAEQAERGMESSDQRRWWDQLELELGNLRAALAWTAAQPQSDRLLHFAGLLGRFWRTRDHLQEGLTWLDAAVRRMPVTQSPTADNARALNWLAVFQMNLVNLPGTFLQSFSGDLDQPIALLERSAAEARAVGEQRLLSMALRHLGLALYASAEYQRAGRVFQEAVAVSREAESKREIAWNLAALAATQFRVGAEHSSVRVMLDESVTLGRESGDLTAAVYPLMILGRLYASEGNAVQARAVCEEALALVRQIEQRFLVPGLLVQMGDFATSESDWHTAADLYSDALRQCFRVTPRDSLAQTTMAHVVRHYAVLLAARDDYRRAVRFLGATAQIELDLQRDVELAAFRPAVVIDAARSALDDREFEEAWAEGQSMSVAQASADILNGAIT